MTTDEAIRRMEREDPKEARRMRLRAEGLDFRNLLVEEMRSGRLRLFRALVFGSSGISISIQANYGAYCTPRESREDLEYTAWEIALLGEDGFIQPRKGWPHADAWSSSDQVAAYVPTEDVNDLVRYLAVELGWPEPRPEPRR